MTLGSMDVIPFNSAERIVTCICLLMGVFLFSSLISVISAKMMRHYLQQSDRVNKLTALRRFLVRKVHSGVSLAAQAQAEKVLSSSGTGRPVTMKEVEAVVLLSESLRR